MLKKQAGIALAGAMFALAVAAPPVAMAADGTITLGAALSASGRYAVNGKHTKNGYELAVKRINAQGGVKVGGKTYMLKVKYYDDESKPAYGAQLAERLILQDKIRFMLGPYSSGMTKAVAPITERYKVLMVEGNGASRSLFNQGFKYLFAVLSTSEQYLSSAMDLAAEQAKKDGRKVSSVRVALGVRNDPFSLDVAAGIRDDAKRLGMKIVIDDKFPKDVTDMTVTLTKVKALKPDVLVVSAHTLGAALLIRQIREQKVYVPLLAITHCEAAKVTDKAKFGDAAEGTLCAAQWSPNLSYRDKWFGSAADYAKAFEKAYGYVPPYQSAESAAAVLVFADAFRRAGSLDTEKVRVALAATDMQTFYGFIKFDKTGKNIAKPMILRQVQGGEYKLVAPSKWATHKLAHPRKRP